jgi:uncharacterized protein (TIGR01319 family)
LSSKKKNDLDHVNIILATDCGSTTTKARFFKKINGEYRFVASGEAPTTVEAPYENVTLGVRNAVREVEELADHKLLDDTGIIFNKKENVGVDLYVTTSSAGGGLQMQVTGIIKSMTAESANRSALGAGAIVMDILAINDGRDSWEKIERTRFLRPDMILIAGGVDGGNIAYPIEIAELIRAANPQHRLGSNFRLPIVYAGNKSAQTQIKNILSDNFAIQIVDNIRPTLDMETPEKARAAIHELFMEHVMSHAPGYDELMTWTSIPIMPTPAGEGMMFMTFADSRNVNLIGVGLGGATTNIYSIYEGKFVRSVSANLGMSYSICNVLKETGIQNINRWIPFKIPENKLLNRLRNKMIRPTTVPQTLEDLFIEHAVAREALRMGFKHHKSIARPLLGSRREDPLEHLMSTQDRTITYLDLMNIDWLGGTGGLLSHAPRRVQSALILIDGFEVEGITGLFQDSVFMIPHLGVLSTVHQKAALDIFEKDCLVMLGTCIAPQGNLKASNFGKKIADIKITKRDNKIIQEDLVYGTIKNVPLEIGETAQVEIDCSRPFKMANGVGRKLNTQVQGGVVGIILDGRGRPITLPTEDRNRRKKLIEWFSTLQLYPKEFLDKISEM